MTMTILTQSGGLTNYANIAYIRIERAEDRTGKESFTLAGYFTNVASTFAANSVAIATYATASEAGALRDQLFVDLTAGTRVFSVRDYETRNYGAWKNTEAP